MKRKIIVQKKISYNVKAFEFQGQTHFHKYAHSISRLDEFSKADKNLHKDSSSARTVRKYHTECEINEAVQHSVNSSKSRTIQSVYNYALANTWQGFLTLTFDQKLIDSSNYDLITEKTKNWLSHLKQRYCKNLKYIFVPELHSDKLHFHFHALIADFDNLPLVNSGKKDNSGRIIYNLPLWNYGFSTLTLIAHDSSDKAVGYMLKYITKDLCTSLFNKKRYWASRNLKKPVIREILSDDDFFYNFIRDNSEFVNGAKSVDIKPAYNIVEYYYMQNVNKNEST